MVLTTETQQVANQDTLREAIRLRFSTVWPALNLANALAGYQSEAWKLVRKYSANELLDAAIEMGLDPTTMTGAVEDNPIRTHSLYITWSKQKIAQQG
jgi:hypothetical protein